MRTHSKPSCNSVLDAWREDIDTELTCVAETAAADKCFEAVDLLSIYYVTLQILHHAWRCGTLHDVQAARADVSAAESQLKSFVRDHPSYAGSSISKVSIEVNRSDIISRNDRRHSERTDRNAIATM